MQGHIQSECSAAIHQHGQQMWYVTHACQPHEALQSKCQICVFTMAAQVVSLPGKEVRVWGGEWGGPCIDW